MKITFALVALAVLSTVESAAEFPEAMETLWKNFKQVYHKSYSILEEEARKQAWNHNVELIILHNLEQDLGKHSFRLGINEYADMSHHDFVRTMNGYRKHIRKTSNRLFISPYNIALPDSVDWRKQGLVTGVKNQSQCGSCWAFSTTGSLEGQHMKKTGKLVSLSEQNLVDCSRSEGNHGCEGGWMDQGFNYIQKNGGIDTEKSYPYTAKDGICHYKSSDSGATLTGRVDIPYGDETALRKAVAIVGPVSVAIDASRSSFHLYRGGIYDEPNCSSQQLDHAVLAVGYGTEDGKDYWLIKNSWGTSWGESGYIKMTRNKKNQCGIASRASYPLV